MRIIEYESVWNIVPISMACWMWVDYPSTQTYGWYEKDGKCVQSEDIKENVLYRSLPNIFITRIDEKLICLEIDTHLINLSESHKQLHDLIEGGLSVYDAFKVMAL